MEAADRCDSGRRHAYATDAGALGAPDGEGTELCILHAIPRVLDYEDVPMDAAEIRSELSDAVEAASWRVDRAAGVEVVREVLWGETPADEIVSCADREDAGLIVLGTHGHGAVQRALIGSVASSMARRASCPVLLVPPAIWREEP